MTAAPDPRTPEVLCGACYDGEHRAHSSKEACACVRCNPRTPDAARGEVCTPAFDRIGGDECPTCLGRGIRCNLNALITCYEGCDRCDAVITERAEAVIETLQPETRRVLGIADHQPDAPTRDIEALIEASSLGTPEAKALRATVSDEHAARIVKRAQELADAPTREGVLTEEDGPLLPWQAQALAAGWHSPEYVAAHEAAARWATWQSLHDDLCTMRDWSGQCFVHANPYRGAR